MMFYNTKHLREAQNGCAIKYKEVSDENTNGKTHRTRSSTSARLRDVREPHIQLYDVRETRATNGIQRRFL